MKGWWVVPAILILLFIDQALKVWIKTHLCLGESIHITDWFYLLFVENKGMAYGMSFINKYLLTGFRMIASVAIAIYIYKVLQRQYRNVYLFCLVLIFAGAVGNIIDCIFYGQIFSVSTHYLLSEFVPFGQGYAPLMLGKVVDMFYFPLIVTTWPDWMPICGGQEFIFFSPVFNFADACISIGVVALILFCRKELEEFSNSTVKENEAENNCNEHVEK